MLAPDTSQLQNHLEDALARIQNSLYTYNILLNEFLAFYAEASENGDSMLLLLPDNVKNIITSLESAGYEAFAVGGCVRDALLNRVPGDWDITTSASPQVIKGLFRRTVDTGIKHGTVTVLIDKDHYEVTTYRIDGIYEDNRHPVSVEFTDNLSEDLRRRDFTINAMAYNERTGLVDLFGGREDLNNHIIRCVGNASERFGEDALRILRAVRFSAQLGFNIEASTDEAIRRNAHNLAEISAERIRDELAKILKSPHPESLKLASEMGILHFILPEWDIMLSSAGIPRYSLKPDDYTVEFLNSLRSRIPDAPISMYWACLLAGIQKSASDVSVKSLMMRLKSDNDTINKTTGYVARLDYNYTVTAAGIRYAMYEIGEDNLDGLIILQKLDAALQEAQYSQARLTQLDDVSRQLEIIRSGPYCVSLKQLKINGSDLISLGIKPGTALGDILHRMLMLCIEHPEYNTREYLLEYAIKQNQNV